MAGYWRSPYGHSTATNRPPTNRRARPLHGTLTGTPQIHQFGGQQAVKTYNTMATSQSQFPLPTHSEGRTSDLQLLGPITSVKTKDKDYKVDPFCSSVLDYQRKVKDEMSKLLNLLVRYGCKKEIGAEFLQDRGQPQHGCSRISYDFYYLLKHLRYRPNAQKYAAFLHVDERKIIDPGWKLNRVRNKLAHQGYLEEEADSLPAPQSDKQRSAAFTDKFISQSIDFAELVRDHVEDSEIKRGMSTAVTNLHGIRKSLEELREYKTRFYQNLKLSASQKKQKAIATLQVLGDYVEKNDHPNDITEFIATCLAARFK